MTTALFLSPSPAAHIRRCAPFTWLALAASLAACGGGGGGGDGTPAPGPGPTPAERFVIGGTVSGLAPASGASGSSRLVLQNNEGDDLVPMANGRFVFATPLAAGSAYAVRVKSQPEGQTCTVAQGSGAMPGAAVDSVQVACATAVWGLPEGAWVRENCGPITHTPNHARSLWRLTRQDETRMTITQGSMLYANADCSGSGTAQSEKEYARFEVDRKETRGGITAFWGNWIYNAAPNNPTRAVFARSGPYLCWGADHFWAQFPTMDSVEQIVVGNAAQSGQCYLQPN